MALDINALLIAVGLMIVGAFFGSLVFRHFRLPDTLFLILLGVLLGPVSGFVSIETFRAIAPLVGTVAIVIILFDGGLKIRVADLVKGVATGSVLAFIVFGATSLLCALVMHVVAGFDASYSVLMGMALGGAGVAIVIPLIQEMGVEERSQTIVSVEAATSDVLVVVGVVTMSTAISLEQTQPDAFLRTLAQTFSVGIAVGIAAGLGWAKVLREFTQRSYEYVLTMAALFLMYGLVELLNGSGALAVLAFGLIVGNSRKTEKVDPEAASAAARRRWQYAPVFGLDLVNLHHEMVFFIRAFFFVALGVILDLSVLASERFVAVGLLLSLAVVVARFWGVGILFSRSKIPAWDKLSMALMFPLGLAAAALSIVPYDRFGLEPAREFGSYAAVVILSTNLFSSLFVWGASTEAFRRWFRDWRGDKEMPGLARARPWSPED